MKKKRTLKDKMALRISVKDDEDKFKQLAETFTCPSLNSAAVILNFNREQDLDIASLIEVLSVQCDASVDGDLARVESMLVAQAHALQSMFTAMSIKMADTEILNHLQVYGQLAFKAQNQCRQTLATLTEIKNPRRSTFVKQQNNAINQQIKNEKPENYINQSNELLEVKEHERLDFGAQAEAVTANSKIEAVD